MYRIIISPQAKKELKIIRKVYRKGLAEAIESIKDDPQLGKPLARELRGKLSYRVGIYRIIYKVNDQDKTVQVIAAGHRGTVYK